MSEPDFDIAVVGGGFYGCCLALFLRSVADKVVLFEAGGGLLERASRVNQARLHAGFHYPRSFVTALRSRLLQGRFAADFSDAVVDDFDMLYAIARRRSKISADRFHRMFAGMEAPISNAPRSLRALFDLDLIEDVFLCKEFAFDWSRLRSRLAPKLASEGVTLRLGETVERVETEADGMRLHSAGKGSTTASLVFNVTYASINALLLASGLKPLELKHELAEVALVEPPADFHKLAVTVMDGLFFSAMPYPSERLYSLTHVRYTPHFSWVDGEGGRSPYRIAESLPKDSRWRHMVLDAARYIPSFSETRYRSSLFDVKTVLVKNERDDGRPILLHQHKDAPRLFSVMGAKIDNIYDLFEALPAVDPRLAAAHERRLFA